jgi:hypothetical protein
MISMGVAMAISACVGRETCIWHSVFGHWVPLFFSRPMASQPSVFAEPDRDEVLVSASTLSLATA